MIQQGVGQQLEATDSEADDETLAISTLLLQETASSKAHAEKGCEFIHTWPRAQSVGSQAHCLLFFTQCAAASELDHPLHSSFTPSQGSQWTPYQMTTWIFFLYSQCDEQYRLTSNFKPVLYS